MAEILFILVTVYAVYVIHSVVSGDYKKKPKSVEVKAVAEKPKPKPKVVDVKPTVKKEIKKPISAAKKVVKKTPVASNLRNPETQEVAKVANSYRMTKRWIKEALVTEGLLDKVYKTSELDAAAKEKISKALAQLAKIEKYQE